MALTVEYNDVGKGLSVDGSMIFDVYGKMFDPNLPSVPDGNITVHNQTTSFNLLGFQPGLEVSLGILQVANRTSSTISGAGLCWLQQYIGGSWVTSSSSEVYLGDIDLPGESGGEYRYTVYRCRMGIDPDEYRPGITQYRYKWDMDGDIFYSPTITVSNLSFDTTPHPAGYLWVEGDNLCYVPPSIYSGSKDTGYKHIISYDSGYSGAYAGTDKKGSIWIPSSSSDGHIYYVSQYGTVQRTMPAYEWSGGPSYVGSNKSGFIWMTPSTSSIPEQGGYNYLCYVDGGGYRRRMGVGEI